MKDIAMMTMSVQLWLMTLVGTVVYGWALWRTYVRRTPGRHRMTGLHGLSWAYGHTGEHRPAPGAGHSLFGRFRARLDDRTDRQVEELVGDIRWGWSKAAYGRGARAYEALNERVGARLKKIRRARVVANAEAAEAVARHERSVWGTPMVEDSW